MPLKRNYMNLRKMDEDNESMSDVSVVDVYDIASEIGKECEKIIDQYGADAVTALMPKVINALELLETLATRNERENTQMQDLRAKIAQLENDKLEKAEYRQKFEKELEAIEEQWRSESKELLSLVSRLQDENRRLVKDSSPSHPPLVTNVNGDVLEKLRDNIEKQREEIRVKDNILQEKSNDVENLRTQIDRLNVAGKELRKKQKLFQGQVRTLCDERADFLVQLQDQRRDILALRQRLGLAQKENEDLAKSDGAVAVNEFDPDDPNRPRFTTQELKDILHERNELKARVSDLEDELETYRPKNKPESPVEEDAPVQGPLPFEPEDAPWKRSSESGIRKFFRKIFSEGSGNGSSFPRRSLSTLSKMALSAATDQPIPV